jgi:hypothetical protein
MRLGVLDVGSNTVHLLVVDAHPGAHPWPAHSQKERLRLAEQLDPDGSLSKAGARALIEACAQAKEASERLDVDEMLAFATSAVRDASNCAEVLRDVWLKTGVDLRVLSGEDEARMTFLAVRRWFGWSAGRLLVLDIGGGSLEIAAGIDESPSVAALAPARRRKAYPRLSSARPAHAGRAGFARVLCGVHIGQSRAGRGRRMGSRRDDVEDLPHARPARRCRTQRRRALAPKGFDEGGACIRCARSSSAFRRRRWASSTA